MIIEWNMSINSRIYLIVISIYTIVGVYSQCTDPETWVAIPEDEYNRNSSSLNPSGRPLGFAYTILPYAPDGGKNPCYLVQGTHDKRVEIMAEPYGGMNSKICVRDQNRPITCSDGKLYSCDQANADSLTVEFYCDTGCDQSDVSMWVRFVVTPDDYADPEDFCDDRSSDEYPSTLIPPPPDQTRLPIITEPDTGGTGTQIAAGRLVLLINFIVNFLVVFFSTF